MKKTTSNAVVLTPMYGMSGWCHCCRDIVRPQDMAFLYQGHLYCANCRPDGTKSPSASDKKRCSRQSQKGERKK